MILLEAILILYVFLIVLLVVGFIKLPSHNIPQDKIPTTGFSILIPFRNEAENLERLLLSLAALKYPEARFETLLINDASTDASVEIIETFLLTHKLPLKILDNERFSGSPKKDALTKGIAHAAFDWIVTTDADCQVPVLWLDQFNALAVKNSIQFIAGPVSFFSEKGILNAFQHLDFLSLQGATIGSFGLNQAFMCNGANLAFSKIEFLRLNGYEKTNHIASGDDLFLMQKFSKANPKGVVYLKTKEALVLTTTQKTFNDLLQQRKRWAAKASAYTSGFAIATSFLVFFGNLSVLAGFFFLEQLGFLILLKFTLDYTLIYLSATLFDQKKVLKHFIWVVLVYPFFTIYVAVASQFGKFEWKGRAFKK